MLQQQGVNLILRGVVVARLLADFDAGRIAARELKYSVADQAVVQDDVGFVEQAQRAQRQQPRIAGTRADQRHRSAMSNLGFAQDAVKFSLRLDAIANAQQLPDAAIQQTLVETPTHAQIGMPRANRVTPALQ